LIKACSCRSWRIERERERDELSFFFLSTQRPHAVSRHDARKYEHALKDIFEEWVMLNQPNAHAVRHPTTAWSWWLPYTDILGTVRVV
jgi:hypothetical protein